MCGKPPLFHKENKHFSVKFYLSKYSYFDFFNWGSKLMSLLNFITRFECFKKSKDFFIDLQIHLISKMKYIKNDYHKSYLNEQFFYKLLSS